LIILHAADVPDLTSLRYTNEAITVTNFDPTSPPSNLGSNPRTKYKPIGPGALQSIESSSAIKFAANAMSESESRKRAENVRIVNAEIKVRINSTTPIANAI